MFASEKKDNIVTLLGNCFDLELREFDLGGDKLYVLYLEGSTDKELLSEQVLRPIGLEPGKIDTQERFIEVTFLPVKVMPVDTAKELSRHIALGEVAVVAENFSLTFSLRKVAMRAVTEPPTATVLKGPREGFTEEIRSNISLLRRRLRCSTLRLDKMQAGRYSQTDIVVAYIDGIASKKIVKKIKDKISGIDIDGIIDSSYIGKFLEEKTYSLFRQVGTTEKPDILAAKMLEGRIGIFVDGSPIVLTLPFLFVEDVQNSNDYFKRDVRAAFIRIIRMLGGIMAVFLPAAYIAVQEFQYQILPIKFIITILNTTSATPLSPTIEMVFVVILFEIINETSIRMPKYVGMAVSLVGAIVLGETAVKAGILSSPAVLITALSGLGLYCIPDEAGSFSMLRILFLGLAGIVGMYGIVVGIVVFVAYVVCFNEFETPYTAPYAPGVPEDRKDGIFKLALKEMKTRPRSIPNINKKRMGTDD